jgi:hypothetical protein
MPNPSYLTGASPEECWPLVRDFHYSRRMPSNIQHCYALRGDGGLFGDYGEVEAIAMFCIPPTRWSEDVLELARLVRRPTFNGQLSMLLGFATKRLRKNGHALLVSFADRTQRHFGGVYQAASWCYGGCREVRMDGLIIDGVFWPGRSCNSSFGTRSPDRLKERKPNADIEPHYDEGKHLYWKPLTVAGRTRAKRLGLKSLPYIKEFAARLSDDPEPTGVSLEHTQGAAP